MRNVRCYTWLSENICEAAVQGDCERLYSEPVYQFDSDGNGRCGKCGEVYAVRSVDRLQTAY